MNIFKLILVISLLITLVGCSGSTALKLVDQEYIDELNNDEEKQGLEKFNYAYQTFKDEKSKYKQIILGNKGWIIASVIAASITTLSSTIISVPDNEKFGSETAGKIIKTSVISTTSGVSTLMTSLSAIFNVEEQIELARLALVELEKAEYNASQNYISYFNSDNTEEKLKHLKNARLELEDGIRNAKEIWEKLPKVDVPKKEDNEQNGSSDKNKTSVQDDSSIKANNNFTNSTENEAQTDDSQEHTDD